MHFKFQVLSLSIECCIGRALSTSDKSIGVVRGVSSAFEDAQIILKWRPTMNLAIECAKNLRLQDEKL